MINSKLFKSILHIILCIIPVTYIVLSLGETFLDDAYITLTYSKHFFEHGKPWYNLVDTFQGNGQTSILWMIIQSVFFVFKDADHVIINKILGMTLSIIFIYELKQLINKTNFNKFSLIFISLFTFFFSFWLALNISHGLETVLYAVCIFLFLKYRDTNIARFIVLILPFIRPEAIILSIFYIIDSKFFSKEFLKRIIIVSVSSVIYLSYTNYFYSIITPLPFLLKNTRNFNPIKIRNFIAIVIIFLPIISYTFKNYSKKSIIYFPLFFFIIYYSFFIDEVMNIFDRYRFPLIAYYLYFLLYEDHTVFKNNYLVVTFSAFAMLFYFNTLIHQKDYYKYSYSPGMINGPVFLGKYLKKESSIANNKKFNIINCDAGAIAYFSECNLYDDFGLNNANLLLAKKENNWKKYLEYLEKADPDYIILISLYQDKYEAYLDFEERIYDYFFLKNKKPVVIRKFDDEYYYFLYKIK